MKDLISIIVPVYRVEKYLKKCIDSLLTQTYPFLEIILVDDGSPDSCPEICDEYAQNDSRIVVIHTENGGVSKARNMALNIAKGKYIGFVDADDWIEPNMYEVLYQTLKDSNAQISIVSCLMEHESDNDKAMENSFSYNEKNIVSLDSKEALKYMCLGNLYEGHMWLKLVDRELFEAVRFPEDITICEDMLVSTQLFLDAKRVSYYPYYGYHYLQREDSAIHKITDKNVWSVQDACDRMCSAVQKKYPDIISYFDCVSMKQDLILAMRLNYAGLLNNHSLNKLRHNIRKKKYKASFHMLRFGSRIRINTLLVGKPFFSFCNWAFRKTRMIR